MIKVLLVSSFFVGIFSQNSLADGWKATSYELGSNKTKALYTSEDKEEKIGSQIVGRVTFFDPQGQVVVTEDYTTEKGKLIKYVLTQKQLNEIGTVEVKDARRFFTFTRNGQTSTDDEKNSGNLVVGPVIVPFMQSHWDELIHGETIDVRFAAMDRKETVGFKFFKFESGDQDPAKVVLIKMKPSSIIISALVDPLVFIFDKATKKLLEIKGRTMPRQKIDGKWKDLDADTFFTN